MKIALITKSQASSWISCQSISANLLKSYLNAEPDDNLSYEFQHFFFDQQSQFSTESSASRVREWGAQKIIFLDHAPCPGQLIQELFHQDAYYKPEIIVHVFGDFTLNAQSWVNTENALKNYPLKFVCASKKQAALLEQFIIPQDINKESLISVMSFPVSEKHFYFSEEFRHSLRAEKNISSSDTVFLYSGRLSLQKNILPLIRAFDFYQRHVNPNSYLWLAGPIDDLGNPYLGKRSPTGLMAYDIQNLIQDLFSGERKSRINYLGHLDHIALNKVYCAADIFISLSTHNDEDYGMAPAEALMTGCPCILSNWGGYSDFKKIAPNLCSLVPVHFGNKKIAPEHTDILRTLLGTTFSNNSDLRKRLAEDVHKILGLDTAKIHTKNLLSEKITNSFLGFQSSFKRLAQSFQIHPEAPLSCAREYSALYKEIYHVYSK